MLLVRQGVSIYWHEEMFHHASRGLKFITVYLRLKYLYGSGFDGEFISSIEITKKSTRVQPQIYPITEILP